MPKPIREHIAAKNVTRGAEQVARNVGGARIRRALDRAAEVSISNRDNPIDAIFHTNHALSSPENVYVRRGTNLWIMKTRNWNSLLKDIEAAAPAAPDRDPNAPSTSKREAKKKNEEWEKPWLKKDKDEEGDDPCPDSKEDKEKGDCCKPSKSKKSGSTSHYANKGGDFFKMEGLEHLLSGPRRPLTESAKAPKGFRIPLAERSDIDYDDSSAKVPTISDGPTKKRIGKAERQYVQFSVCGPGDFSPTGSTVEGLQPGLYRLSQDYNGNIHFNESQLDSDSLLRFEDARYADVISQVSRFWGMKEKYENMGMIHKRGLLLFGPPGTGKSCLLKLVMEDAITQGNIVVIAEDVRAVAQSMGPLRQVEPDRQVLVILEDVDDMSEHALLQVFDGDNTASNILYLGTTNYVERLAPRVLRPGRFDLKIEVGPPPDSGRRAFFKGKTTRLNLSDETIEAYVKATEKFSFGQLREFLVSVHCYDESPESAAKKLANGGFINESAITDASLALLLC